MYGYAVFNGTDKTNVELTYPNNKDGSAPFGRSFHHGRFVMRLREAATKAPNVTIVTGTVNHLIEEDKCIRGVSYKVNGCEKKMKAPLVVVSDGVFSKFRKDIVTNKPVVNSSFVGFVVSVQVSALS